MRALLFAIVGAAALLVGDIQFVEAQVSTSRNPWCSRQGGMWSCGYQTRAQCEAAVSGVGGYCTRNPNYRGPRR